MRKWKWKDTDKRAFVSGILKVTIMSVATILVWRFVDSNFSSGEYVTGSWDVTMHGKHVGTLYSYQRREDVFWYYVFMANLFVLSGLMAFIESIKPVWTRLVGVCLYGARYVRRSDVAHVTVVREKDGTKNIVRSGWIVGKKSKRMRRFIILSRRWRRMSCRPYIIEDSKVWYSYRIEQPLLMFISDDDAKKCSGYEFLSRRSDFLDFSLEVWIDNKLRRIRGSGGDLIGTHLMKIDQDLFGGDDFAGTTMLNMADHGSSVWVTVGDIRIKKCDT